MRVGSCGRRVRLRPANVEDIPLSTTRYSPCQKHELFGELSVRVVAEVVSLGLPLDEVRPRRRAP